MWLNCLTPSRGCHVHIGQDHGTWPCLCPTYLSPSCPIVPQTHLALASCMALTHQFPAPRTVLPHMFWKTGCSHPKMRIPCSHPSLSPHSLAHLPSFDSLTTSLNFISFWSCLPPPPECKPGEERDMRVASGISSEFGTVPISELLTDTLNGWMSEERVSCSIQAVTQLIGHTVTGQMVMDEALNQGHTLLTKLSVWTHPFNVHENPMRMVPLLSAPFFRRGNWVVKSF